MADASVTLTQSQNSSSSGVTYRGYVLDSCNNNAHVADGSWSPSSATGIGVSTSGSQITVWNSNTSTSSASATFTWTSSLVSGCSKTLSVTANGKPATITYSIIFKKNGSTITSGTMTGTTYTFDVYYKASNSSTEQSASGIIVSTSSSNSNVTTSYSGNTVTVKAGVGVTGSFDINVCIKPSGASSNICGDLSLTHDTPAIENKKVTIEWAISYGNIMLYNNNTSINADSSNIVNSSGTSGSKTLSLPSEATLSMSVNFSLPGAGYSGATSRKTVKATISCNAAMNPPSSSGTFSGCCISSSGAYTLFTNGGINCTTNFSNIAIEDGAVIFVDINLSAI